MKINKMCTLAAMTALLVVTGSSVVSAHSRYNATYQDGAYTHAQHDAHNFAPVEDDVAVPVADVHNSDTDCNVSGHFTKNEHYHQINVNSKSTMPTPQSTPPAHRSETDCDLADHYTDGVHYHDTATCNISGHKHGKTTNNSGHHSHGTYSGHHR